MLLAGISDVAQRQTRNKLPLAGALPFSTRERAR